MPIDPNDGKVPILEGKPQPTFGMLGPTVEDDIRRAIQKYGKKAVQDAVAKLTRAKRGRPNEKDGALLRPYIEADAREWLAGGDPFSARSNYSIAKDFADNRPGHNHPATMKRIERKLAQKRTWLTHLCAEEMSRDSYPYTAHLRALEALSTSDDYPVFASLCAQAKSVVTDYEAKHGARPPSNMTMKQVQDATQNALLTVALKLEPKASQGLLGTFSLSGNANDKTK